MQLRIRVKQTIVYDQTVEVSDELWSEFEEANEARMCDVDDGPLRDALDVREVMDYWDFDDPRIEIIEDGNVVGEWSPHEPL